MVWFGIKSLSFLGQKIWTIVPIKAKNSKTLDEFKTKIKSWIPQNCPC